jgi:hypothetical protein
VACHRACRTNFKAMKAWAGKTHARLGRKQPKTLLTVHLRSTVERDSRRNKTATQPLPENPSSFQFLCLCSPPKSSERRHAQRPRKRELAAGSQPAGEAAPPAGPLAGVRRSPEGERAAIEPARGSALRWRPEPTRRRPDKRRRTRGPGPFPEHVVFDDGRSGHGGVTATPRRDCRCVLRRVQAATVPTSGGSHRAPSRRPKRQIQCGGEVSPATLSLGLGYSIRVPSF